MKKLNLDEIKHAFSIMGAFLRDRKTIGEIAVYGGGAILLQFEWRNSTRDLDAVVVSQGNHSLVRQAVDKVAAELGLERSWLNESVAAYTSARNEPGNLTLIGMYPESGVPGLRVLAARAEYLLAMKLAALERVTSDDRDFEDARNLAIHVGAKTLGDLENVHRKYFPSVPLAEVASLRLTELENAIKLGR